MAAQGSPENTEHDARSSEKIATLKHESNLLDNSQADPFSQLDQMLDDECEDQSELVSQGGLVAPRNVGAPSEQSSANGLVAPRKVGALAEDRNEHRSSMLLSHFEGTTSLRQPHRYYDRSTLKKRRNEDHETRPSDQVDLEDTDQWPPSAGQVSESSIDHARTRIDQDPETNKAVIEIIDVESGGSLPHTRAGRFNQHARNSKYVKQLGIDNRQIEQVTKNMNCLEGMVQLVSETGRQFRNCFFYKLESTSSNNPSSSSGSGSRDQGNRR